MEKEIEKLKKLVQFNKDLSLIALGMSIASLVFSITVKLL